MDAYHVHSESTRSNVNHPFINFFHKPIMIYYFVDPFCQQCWELERYMKKLTMEYGAFFNVRPIISHIYNESPHRLLDKKEENHIIHNGDHLNKYYGFISIKAAALQGNKAGRDFLRSVQEAIFLYNKNESIHDILAHSVENTNLDIREFENDLLSSSAKKAYESDIQLMHEMDVNQYPTLVFFSQHNEEYSVKVSGLQTYDAYTFVLKKMLHFELTNFSKPTIEACFIQYGRLQTEEIAFIFDLSEKEAEKKLKQLQLMQKVKQVVINGILFWEYCGQNKAEVHQND
ncbi:DsbA family protein [Pseudogracilibacillus auburnensis]|uniref:DsbA family protein n=1 Tax=Pseudogracilibacillus auburnensis TaxID=1494959 RepID=UPI001A964E5C|nr:DsbA family protein [Pseudogracilibacillus auburnensis]MBO1002969.1 DsbA family protein [Pseudogracilibacillus auburnensis]